MGRPVRASATRMVTGSLTRVLWTRRPSHTLASQAGDCLRAGDPVDQQTMGGLEAGHGLLGARPVATIDRPGRVPRPGQPTLQHADSAGAASRVPRAWIQHSGRAAQRRQRARAGDPVDQQTMAGLEAGHDLLGARPGATIDRPGRRPRPGQPTLQHAHRVPPAPVAAIERMGYPFGSGRAAFGSPDRRNRQRRRGSRSEAPAAPHDGTHGPVSQSSTTACVRHGRPATDVLST